MAPNAARTISCKAWNTPADYSVSWQVFRLSESLQIRKIKLFMPGLLSIFKIPSGSIQCLLWHTVLFSIFSCDQAALWMVFSVRLSVCPSVRLSVCLSVCPSVTPFWQCSHHRIIMIFSGVITLDQGKVHAKGQGQRSKVKVTEVTTQIFVSGL